MGRHWGLELFKEDIDGPGYYQAARWWVERMIEVAVAFITHILPISKASNDSHNSALKVSSKKEKKMKEGRADLRHVTCRLMIMLTYLMRRSTSCLWYKDCNGPQPKQQHWRARGSKLYYASKGHRGVQWRRVARFTPQDLQRNKFLFYGYLLMFLWHFPRKLLNWDIGRGHVPACLQFAPWPQWMRRQHHSAPTDSITTWLGRILHETVWQCLL